MHHSYQKFLWSVTKAYSRSAIVCKEKLAQLFFHQDDSLFFEMFGSTNF